MNSGPPADSSTIARQAIRSTGPVTISPNSENVMSKVLLSVEDAARPVVSVLTARSVVRFSNFSVSLVTDSIAVGIWARFPRDLVNVLFATEYTV